MRLFQLYRGRTGKPLLPWKRLLLLALAASIAALLALSRQTTAFTGCEEDCLKCHSMSTEEAGKILDSLQLSGATAEDIRMSPVKGLWEMTVNHGGKKGILYVSFSKKHVVRGPIVSIETGIDESRKVLEKTSQEKPKYVDYGKIPTVNAPLMGNPAAEHRVIVFTDPDCSYCARLHEELKKVTVQRDDIAFALKLFPLSFHPDAYWKSQTVLCSGDLVYLEDNFHKKPIPKPEPGCATGEVDENIRLGKEFGITGTPTMIMPDGLIVVGYRDADDIIELVLSEKERGG